MGLTQICRGNLGSTRVVCVGPAAVRFPGKGSTSQQLCSKPGCAASLDVHQSAARPPHLQHACQRCLPAQLCPPAPVLAAPTGWRQVCGTWLLPGMAAAHPPVTAHPAGRQGRVLPCVDRFSELKTSKQTGTACCHKLQNTAASRGGSPPLQARRPACQSPMQPGAAVQAGGHPQLPPRLLPALPADAWGCPAPRHLQHGHTRLGLALPREEGRWSEQPLWPTSSEHINPTDMSMHASKV